MKPTLSLCMIVRDESEHLAKTLASVREHVDELVIVDTGSSDDTRQIAANDDKARVFYFFQPTHPEAFLLDDVTTGAPPPHTGEHFLADFGAARNYALEQCRGDYVLWLDADDLVDGAEKFPGLLEEMAARGLDCLWFPYEYGFDIAGRVTTRLWRERVVRRGSSARWQGRIHEIMTPFDFAKTERRPEVVIKHQRQYLDQQKRVRVAHRNYKVLLDEYKKTQANPDPRTLYYLGNEARWIDPDKALEVYDAYAAVSGWPEERCVARCVMGTIWQGKGDLLKSEKEFAAASVDFPERPDPWFGLGYVAYCKKDWARAVAMGEHGLALGNPESDIVAHPLERTFVPHTWLNVALNHLGRVRDAVASCDAALAVVPDDSNLLYNRKLYAAWLAEHPEAAPATGQQRSVSLSANESLDAPAQDLPNPALSAVAIQIWKRLMGSGEKQQAAMLIASLPGALQTDPQIREAARRTGIEVKARVRYEGVASEKPRPAGPRVSLCMIARDEEENLAACLRSIAGHVDEMIVCDTGSLDRTPLVARESGAKLVYFTKDQHPEAFFVDDEKALGPAPHAGDLVLADFAGARNESFKHATGEYILWLDADDVLQNPEEIRAIVAVMKEKGLDFGFMPYNYATDGAGRVVYRQWRERVVRRGAAKWTNPVHEVMVPLEGTVKGERFDRATVIHRRKADRKMTAHRNYKILLRDLARMGDQVDPRALFYLGNEARMTEPDRAMDFYQRYLLCSGWPEERAAAHCSLGELHAMKGQHGAAFSEFAAAALTYPESPDGLLGCARISYFLSRWPDVVRYTEEALKLGVQDSMLGANQVERAYRPHLYFNYALNKVGRIADALASCEAGLAICPDDPGAPDSPPGVLRLNLGVYKAHVSKEQAKAPRQIEFSKDEDAEAPPPAGVPHDAQVIWGMQLWKQLVQAGDKERAAALLDSLPTAVRTDPAIERCRAATAKRFAPRPEGQYDVVLWTGPAFEPWGPWTPNETGIGGSETAAIEMSRELVKRGHRVTVYSDTPRPGIFHGVDWRDYRSFAGCRCDVFISSRQPHVVEHPVEARAKFLWVHDIHVGENDAKMQAALLKYDRILALSAWHRDFLQGVYPTVHPGAFVVTRNGIDPARFADVPLVRKNHLLFPSSPNRGLDTLIGMLPHIRQRVPDAEVHVYYGFDCWEKIARSWGNMAELDQIEKMRALIARTEGVVNHGRVSQHVLAKRMMASKVWCYPTMFQETFCVTAAEMQAAGVVPVATRLAALPETIKHGVLIDPGPDSGPQFVEHTVQLLQDDSTREAIAAGGREYALANLSWAALAADWEALFKRTIAEVAARIVPDYRSAA